jgi:circadian clock protein KaiC
VRELDLSFDEIVHELLSTVDAIGATRVVLDSLSGLELALTPDYQEEFRESLYRLSTVLRTKGVTVLMTSELEDNFQELRLGSHGSGVLVDAIVLQRFVEAQCALHTVITVAKVRGSRHSRDFRTFDVTEQGIVIGSGPAPFDGVLRGSARMREPDEW